MVMVGLVDEGIGLLLECETSFFESGYDLAFGLRGD